ncbi:hypothetical protein V2J09_015464 [Rumex salicifolius]
MIEMEPFRLRLKFNDSVLSDYQKADGLKRSWVLVEPRHRTISDLISYLLHAFDLWDSCPHGIFLSVEGFALPHFESIAVLNNADLVVKRKGSKLCLEKKVDKKLPFTLGMPVSVNEEFEKEVGGFQSESEEIDEDVQTDLLDEENVTNGDVSIMKRKASKQLKNSKKKRKCKTHDSSSSQKEHSNSYLQNGYCQKKSPKSKQDQVHNQVCSNIDNWEGIVSLSSEPDEAVKVSMSRCARRRKIQKQRGRVAEQLHKKKSQGEGLDDENHLKISDQDTESGDDVVPVVVRPGHIRFTAPGKGKDVQQYQGAKESLNWCGITNNKKCKNWSKGKQSISNQKQPTYKQNEFRATQDKQPASKWNENISSHDKQSANARGGNRSTGEWKSGSKWNDYRNRGRSWMAKKAPPTDASKEYEKLVPLTDFPLEGDIIAYRLLDMSSSFCPVMTSYRVGKVSSSDPKTNRVELVPVPEYPFEYKKATDDKSKELADASRYKEDGTLEIDFPSLSDVRIVQRGRMNKANGTSENGSKDVWEEITAAASAKKAELLKEDNWNKKRKPTNYTWSYRTIRSRALDPDIALLRPQNGNGNGNGGAP